MRFTIARVAGRCRECRCRFRPGELIVRGRRTLYHADCYMTRGSRELRPYEDEQPAAMDRLLALIQAEELLCRGSEI